MADPLFPIDDLRTAPEVDPVEPDAHGQAALLLAEATLHALIVAGTLSVEQAITAVRSTCEIKAEVAAARHESAKRMNESLDLLRRIERSLSADRDRA